MHHTTRRDLVEVLVVAVISLELTYLGATGVISPDNTFYGLGGIAAGFGYFRSVRRSRQIGARSDRRQHDQQPPEHHED